MYAKSLISCLYLRKIGSVSLALIPYVPSPTIKSQLDSAVRDEIDWI